MTTRKRGPLSGYGYLPPGGGEGDVLLKNSEVDGDAGWGSAQLLNEYIRVKSLGAVADGSEANATADTEAAQSALQLAADHGGGKVVFENGNYQIASPLTVDSHNTEIVGDGATITGAGTVIFASFSSGEEDLSVNNGLLGGLGLRSNVTQSLQDVRLVGLKFVAGTATRAIWFTRFTRGCEISHCSFQGFTDYDILINGSWTFSLTKNRCSGVADEDGDSTGVGIGLGINGEGRGSGATICNAVDAQGNWCGRHSTGAIWNGGVGGFWGGNTFEFNRVDGFRTQSSDGFTFCGNYLEKNGNDNAQFGGTNGDFCNAVVCRGNIFNADTGSNMKLNAVRNSVFGPNHFSGSRTQHYNVPTTFNTGNEIWVPEHTSDYISGHANLDNSTNRIVTTGSLTRPTINGSRGGNTALTSLLTQLATLNMIVDGTSA